MIVTQPIVVKNESPKAGGGSRGMRNKPDALAIFEEED